jgi:hypothetical protein
LGVVASGELVDLRVFLEGVFGKWVFWDGFLLVSCGG